MIAYFDTAALVKLVVAEPGSDRARLLWERADVVVASLLVYVEARAALGRAQREDRVDADEAAAARQGLDAVTARLGLVPPTRGIVWAGRDHVDARFAENWRAAGAAGVRRGAYHFFTLCTPAADQARNFLATVPDDGELPPALDLELAGNCSRRPARDDVLAEVRAFLDAVEARGERVLLYVGEDFADRYFRDVGGREQWRPSVLRRPGGTWRVWQASAWARVAGVDGGVDLDVLRTD